MSSQEHTRQLLRLPPLDLFRIHKTLTEMLVDTQHIVPADLHQAVTNGQAAFTAFMRARRLRTAKKAKKREEGQSEESKEAKTDAATAKSAKVDHKFQPELTFFTSKSGTNKRTMVLFAAVPQLGVRAIAQLQHLLDKAQCKTAIVVVERGVTPAANAPLAALRRTYSIRLFLQEELLVNITHHSLVPEHRAATEQEIQELVRTYKFKPTDLYLFPKLFDTDPVARYYGWAPDTLVKITRPGQPPSYRIVIERPLVFTG